MKSFFDFILLAVLLMHKLNLDKSLLKRDTFSLTRTTQEFTKHSTVTHVNVTRISPYSLPHILTPTKFVTESFTEIGVSLHLTIMV